MVPGTDSSDNATFCSTENVIRLRNSKKRPYRNVTNQLTTMTGDFDGDPSTPDTTLRVFDDALQGYFWDYDTDGVRRVQLRFYPVH